MDPRALDPHGCLVDDAIAVQIGLRFEATCLQKTKEGIFCLPTSFKIPRTKVLIVMPEWVAAHINPGDVFTVHNFQRTYEENQITLHSKDEFFLPIKKVGNIVDTCALEAYSGIGGWSHGAKLCGLDTKLCIEQDLVTAEACGRSLGWPVLTLNHALYAHRTNALPKEFVLRADVNSKGALYFISLLGLAIWLISPPCQPWSKAGNMMGLQSEGGQAFVATILNASMLGVTMILAENVPGLAEHEHFAELIALIKKVGWKCVLSSQDGLLPLLPIYRTRWLGIFAPDTMVFDPLLVSRAKNTKLPNSIPGRGKFVSIASAGCLQTNIQEWERMAATPNEEAILAMSSPGFLPLNLRTEENMKLKPEAILQLRTKSGRNIMPNVMASNGSQHELPAKLLAKRGLHAFLIQDDGGNRFALPFEIVMVLGYPVGTQLPNDFKYAWQIAGNGLAIPHSALLCFRAHLILKDKSPFKTEWKSTFDLCNDFHANTIDLEDYFVQCEGTWMKLKHKLSVKVTCIPEEDIQLRSPPKHDEDEEYDARPAKHVCIPPTWTYSDDEPDLIIPNPKREDYNLANVALVTMEPVKGSMVAEPPKPLPKAILHLMQLGLMKNGNDQYMVTLIHEKGHWCKQIWKNEDESIRSCIRRALPHAIKEHFVKILLDMEEVSFQTIPKGIHDCEIIFEPTVFVRIFKPTFHTHDLAVQVDLTWTIKDAIGFVASELAVLPSMVTVYCENQATCDDDYVLAYQSVEFTICFKTPNIPMDNLSFCKPHPLSDAKLPDPCQERINPQQMIEKAEDPDFVRVAAVAVDIKWGSIRTVVCQKSWNIEQMLLLMFPNQDIEFPMCLFIDGRQQPRDLSIRNIIDHDNLTVGTFKLSAVKLEIVCKGMSLGSTSPMQSVFIKGPEDNRPVQRQVSSDFTLAKIAAILIAEYKCNTTMLALKGGKTVDPQIIVGNLPTDSTMEFRICALPGGAKNEEVIRNLANVLTKRGVPSEHATERAKQVIGKIPGPEVKAILSKDEQSMWSELKGLANKAQVRLVTTTELKEHQKKMREEKKEKTKPAQKKAKKEMDPRQVTIELAHFKAGDHRLQAIELGAFGPDASGIAMAKPNEAKNFLPRTKLSADPLAMLVLTQEHFDGHVPQLVPALDHKKQPVLVSAVLLNFGDEIVSFQPNVPKADIVEVETATLEITICKQYVPTWNEAINPLNYLGQKLPELRTGVIAAWNLRFYTTDRTQTNHKEADYAHGFLKVPVTQLEPALQRSGQHGVFVQVKGPNKKPDPAYAIVPLHGYGIDESLSLAKRTPNVLGLVLMGQKGTFALRGRREHIMDIRKAALPQSIAPQEGQIPPGATWWYLRSISTSTNCTELSNALKSLQWDATAIRPSGANTWLVCSHESPPSNHLLLNGQYVAVVACGLAGKKTKETAPRSAIVQGNFSMDPEEMEAESVSTSASTRFEDMKNNLEERLNVIMTEKQILLMFHRVKRRFGM
eukprot:Skav201740  [mRNA]  locus=scaffold2498:224082:229362:- [translate_table: standard]